MTHSTLKALKKMSLFGGMKFTDRMKYAEKKACEIAQIWGISQTTLRVWKHRGQIPDRYNSAPISMGAAIEKIASNKIVSLEKEVRLMGQDSVKEWNRYKTETKVPKGISEKETIQRGRDKIRAMKNAKYGQTEHEWIYECLSLPFLNQSEILRRAGIDVGYFAGKKQRKESLNEKEARQIANELKSVSSKLVAASKSKEKALGLLRENLSVGATLHLKSIFQGSIYYVARYWGEGKGVPRRKNTQKILSTIGSVYENISGILNR
jgi:hypothetical protein